MSETGSSVLSDVVLKRNRDTVTVPTYVGNGQFATVVSDESVCPSPVPKHARKVDAVVIVSDSDGGSACNGKTSKSAIILSSDDESEGSDGSELPESAAKMSPPELSDTDDDSFEALSQTQNTPVSLDEVVGPKMAEILRSNSKQSGASDAASTVSSLFWAKASNYSSESSEPSVVRRKKNKKYEKILMEKQNPKKARQELPKKPQPELGKYAARKRARRFDKSY